MSDQVALIVKLRVPENGRNLLRESLIQLFGIMKDEPTFLTATLHDDLDDPGLLVVYETWQETRESFLANQMSKPYRSEYEKSIVNLHVERTGHWLTPIASWSRHS
jgi:quinol monooxygenase YgiN